MSFGLKSTLLAEIAKGLPGEAAHLPMMPLNRPLSSDALKKLSTYRISAVAVVILDLLDRRDILLILRPTYDGAHSGQIAFPGGKMEDGDANDEATARRECFEEIGFQLLDEHYVGKLTDVYIPVSGFIMHPHLYVVNEAIEFIPDEREVAAILQEDISLFVHDELKAKRDLPAQNGMVLKNVPGFEIENHFVWGATALVLNELSELLQRIKI